ncbi:MAG TPA: hypothetical protein VE008_00025 [Burkholderiales bacterium]|nr:hypothetical protein [Burkholderiales bacterium]
MLIGLLLLVLYGSSGSSPMTAYLDHAREHAEKEFKDKAQREAVLDTLEDMKKAQVEFIEVEKKAAKTLIELAENRDSKPADFQSVIAALRTEAAETQGKLMQLRIRLKSQVTREQWAGLHPAAFPDKADPKQANGKWKMTGHPR